MKNKSINYGYALNALILLFLAVTIAFQFLLIFGVISKDLSFLTVFPLALFSTSLGLKLFFSDKEVKTTKKDIEVLYNDK